MQEEFKAQLETKKIEDSFKKYKTDLEAALENTAPPGIAGKFLSLIGGKSKPPRPLLTKDNAELGLLLINQLAGSKDQESSYNNMPLVEYGGGRYRRIETLLGDADWDSEDNFKLLIYFFGEEKATYARYAWKRIPHQMYQEGYTRRSFRSPANREMYLRLQINFIVRLLRQVYVYEYQDGYQYIYYDLTVMEQVRFSHLLGEANPELFRMWAAAIDMDNEEVFHLAEDIIYNKDAVGKVTKSILKALLNTEKQEAWMLVEKLVLAAQRQEGLRQTVFEALDETSTGALKYMIKVIIDNDLARFSSVVRAVDVWAGMGWESERESTVRGFLEKAQYYLEDPARIPDGIRNQNNADVYMALWAQGVYDVEKTLPYLQELYKTGDVQKRALTILFAEETRHYRINMPTYIGALDDPDLQPLACSVLAICTSVGIGENDKYYNQHYPNLFDKLHAVYKRITIKQKTFESFIFSWWKVHFERKTTLKAMVSLVGNHQDRLQLMVDYLDDMDADVKGQLSNKILPGISRYGFKPGDKPKEPLTKFQHRYALMILKDRSEHDLAYKALYHEQLTAEEVSPFPEWLKRKAASFRSNIITLLLRQKDEMIASVVETLALQGDMEQRLAALDMLLQFKKDNRLTERVAAWIEIIKQKKNITPKEEILLAQLTTADNTQDVSEANGYGLFQPSKIAPVISPVVDPAGLYQRLMAQQAYALSLPMNRIKQAFVDLADLYEKHKDFEYKVENYDHSKEKVLLGNVFREKSYAYGRSFTSKEEKYQDYPLPEVWQGWYMKWQMTGSDLYLLSLSVYRTDGAAGKALAGQLPATMDFLPAKYVKLQGYSNPILRILGALRDLYTFDGADEFFIGAATRLFSSLGDDILKEKPSSTTYYSYGAHGNGWQQNYALQCFLSAVDLEKMDDKWIKPYWDLSNWRQFTGLPENIPSAIPPLMIFCRAYEKGVLNEHDMFRALLHGQNIRLLSARTRHAREYDFFGRFPFVREMFDRVRDHVLDIELKRGDSATSVTLLAAQLQSLYGISRFTEILAGLGKTNLHKGYYSYSYTPGDKQASLSHLLKQCYPLATDTQELFDKAMRQIKATEQRLIEAAIFAPQWQKLISGYLGWKGLEGAIWWMHAHTKTDGYRSQNAEAESEIARYSSLDVEEFKQGAVDKEWFLEAYKEIGKERWPVVYEAAKYITDGNGHRRARIYADVLLGNLNLKDVTEKIATKRDQDYVRIYGLAPLSRTNKPKDVLARYEFLQQFKKDSRQFGAQKQASEAAAIQVAMENLARNAGYPDPIRLTWAMETKQIQSILAKETRVQYDDVVIGLIIDKDGEADVVAFKDDKPLKSIPAKYKKDKKVEELNGFKKTLREQFKRSRKGLEEAMVRGDVFFFKEIKELFGHPVIAKHLEKLIFIGDQQLDGRNAHGFYADGQLVDDNGEAILLQDDDQVRIAHCTDLYQTASWAGYQRLAFDRGLQQPFKQIFRELYLPTPDELNEVSVSRRYAGHQVQPKQTVALLRSRGWKVNYEEGLQKVYHKQQFAVRMYAMADWFSPAEVESPTLETVVFTDLKTYKNVPFADIHPRIFSEVMRDIDLVVSVAHAGAVDPEASQSSIEMRSALLKETIRLFKLDNVIIEGSHAKVKGKLGEYSVHLGSAVVHRMLSGYLSILPVHSQQRGRIFLPFMDDDPRSTELLSKVLLLARDQHIQDPTILQQLN